MISIMKLFIDSQALHIILFDCREPYEELYECPRLRKSAIFLSDRTITK